LKLLKGLTYPSETQLERKINEDFSEENFIRRTIKVSLLWISKNNQ